MLLSDSDEAALLRIQLAEQAREMAELREAGSDAAEAAALRLRAARQEVAALRRALDEAQARAAAPAAREVVLDPPQAVSMAAKPVSIQVPPATSPRRAVRDGVAHPIWRLVRPVVRPLLWRARAFFTADALSGLAELRAAQEALQQAMRDASAAALDERSPVPPVPAAAAPRRAYNAPPGEGLGLGDTAAERWLLTLALEQGDAAER